MRYSFCTTCWNRRKYVEQCLPVSLKHIPAGSEYVLLDYHSPDGLREWVMATFPAELASGRLRLYSDRTNHRFLTPHAKNVAHLLGEGDILINVDADNLVLPEYIGELECTDWSYYQVLAAMTSNSPGEGGGRGRLAIHRHVFLSLGGYNESLTGGWGWDEVDLERRAHHAGMRIRYFNLSPSTWLPNTRQERAMPLQPGFSHPIASNNYNKKISEQQIAAGEFVANSQLRWGLCMVYDHCDALLQVGYMNASKAKAGF